MAGRARPRFAVNVTATRKSQLHSALLAAGLTHELQPRRRGLIGWELEEIFQNCRLYLAEAESAAVNKCSRF